MKNIKSLNFEAEIFNPNEISTLYHVGSMDISNKSRYSLEGNGLSVSICPKEWMKIARMSDSTIWSLSKKDIQMLDYYSLTENDISLSNNWGVAQGYLEECIIFTKTYYDDEFECDLESIHDSFEEAQMEADLSKEYYSYEDYLINKDSEYMKITKLIGYKPTKKLKSISMVDVDVTNAKDINLLIFLEKNTELDGVYWDELLDVSRYSAPRGVIFNSKVQSFERKKVEFCDECEFQEAEYNILDRNLCSYCKEDMYGKDKFNEYTYHYTCSICKNTYFFGFGKCDCYDRI